MTRWLIRGTLTTRSPLHIGSGEAVWRNDVQRTGVGEDGRAQQIPVDVQAVATDARGLCYIPATGLKGALRARLGARAAELLGSPDGAGRFLFRDAHARPGQTVRNAPPYWHAASLTGVGTSVAIDRRTRAASDARLFHYELVPPGISFDVAVTGDGASKEHVLDLLVALAGFNDADDPVTLGSGTGNGWGLCSWKLQDITSMDAKSVAAWLRKGAHECGDDVTVGYGSKQDLAPERVAPAARAVIAATLELVFEAGFLVNDPASAGGRDPRGDSPSSTPDHMPLRDQDGRPYLPATSFRGAMRSQAERILRTVAGDAGACAPHLKGNCGAVDDAADLTKLCPACRLFGATGWRAPLRVSDFRMQSSGGEFIQDFLAIDRFTGGGANHLKFDAQASDRPVLRGSLRLDLDALQRAGAGAWSIGLLALALRDLDQGDYGLGFGHGKGYGRCRVKLVGLTLPAWDVIPTRWREMLAPLDERRWKALNEADVVAGTSGALEDALGLWMTALHEEVV